MNNVEQLPSALYLARQVRELDRIAIQEYGIQGYELMSKAARFAFHCAKKAWPNRTHFLVLCGSGNNAGDGYLFAEIAYKHGDTVSCLYISSPEKLKGDARSAYQSYIKTKMPCAPFKEADIPDPENTVIIDALLGTGLAREVRGDYAEAIEWINAARDRNIRVLSIDIPSGLSADTGCALAIAVNADLTTTFIGNKLGLMTGEGKNYSGDVFFSDLSVPNEVYKPIKTAVTKLSLPSLLKQTPDRTPNAHKGTNGRCVLIGGNYGFLGAIQIASYACARIGAGLTSVITQKEHCSTVVLHTPEVMTHTTSQAQTNNLLEKADVIGIGPGLSTDPWAQQLLDLATNTDCFAVLDADALNLIARNETLPSKIKKTGTHVLTPHPGEAARLLGKTTSEIERDRLSAVKELQAQYGGHIILKGAGTLIAHPCGAVSLCPYGNPGMASGGMGDALTGMLVGLIAQLKSNLPMSQIIELGVCLHAKAADNEAKKSGERGLLASDLAQPARELLNQLKD